MVFTIIIFKDNYTLVITINLYRLNIETSKNNKLY